MKKQGFKIKKILLYKVTGKRLRQGKQACDETFGDKPRTKNGNALDFKRRVVLGLVWWWIWKMNIHFGLPKTCPQVSK
jgi:hypothetical protein